jgi:hypothetical protein
MKSPVASATDSPLAVKSKVLAQCLLEEETLASIEPK